MTLGMCGCGCTCICTCIRLKSDVVGWTCRYSIQRVDIDETVDREDIDNMASDLSGREYDLILSHDEAVGVYIAESLARDN